LIFQGAGSLSPLLRPDTLPYAVTGTLATTPSVAKVTINPVAPAGGWIDGSTTYPVLSYGTWGGSLSDFVIGTASPAFSARQGATLSDTGGMITLTVAGDKARWTGAANGNWTTATVASPFNWRTLAGAVDSQFLTGDDTIFDDTAANANVVISDANISPTSMLFNNTLLNYVVSSPGGFGLSAGILTKTGTGTLTLGGVNTNTGLTTVTEGSLLVGSDTAFQGTNSMVLGSATATTSGTATLDLNGFNARLISLSSGTATTNTITNNGSGTGTNTLTLTLPTTALTSLVTDGPTRKTALSIGARAGNPTNVNNTFSGGFLMYGASGGGEAAGCRLSPVAANNPTVEGGLVVKGTYGTGTITMGLDAADKAQFYFNSANVTIANNLVINSALGSDTPGAFRVEDVGISVNGSVTANKGSVVVHHNGQFSGGPTAGGHITFNGPILAGENPAAGLTVQQLNVSTSKQIIAVLANTSLSPNTYSGNTTLTAANAIIRLGAAEQIPDGESKGNVVFAGNATLDLNDFSETVNGLSGAGFVENINGVTPVTLTVGAGDATGLNFSGRIFDARGGAAVSLTKIGTGTQILSNDNVYTGTTTISAGTLQLGNGGTTGSLLTGSAIVNQGILAFNRSDAVIQGTHFSGSALTGTGGLTKLGAGSLTLNTANTYTGPTLVSAGTLIADGAASFGATKVTLATGSTFDLATLSAADLTLSGGLGGSGLVNAPAKTVIVGTTFDPGVLSVTSNLTLATGTATTLLASDSLATTSAVTVTGSVVNSGTLTINADTGYTFAADDSFTFVTGASITRGFTAVSVGSVALTASSGGVWTGSGSGLAFSYDENTATLTVANGSTLTPLEEWRLTNLGSSENTGDAADSFDKDNDGIPNLLEYALNGNPNIADRSILPVATGGNPLSLTFTRLGDSGITYIVEASDTLATDSWSSIYTSSGTAGPVTVQDPGPVVDNRRFLRLRVTTNL
jgi:autotransporter-associated beta strand protein